MLTDPHCDALRRVLLETVTRHLFASRKPHARQRLHAPYQAIKHGDAQGASGYKWMQANVEIPALPVLLHEALPPQVEDTVGIREALRRVAARVPGEAEVHRIVDCVVEG